MLKFKWVLVECCCVISVRLCEDIFQKDGSIDTMDVATGEIYEEFTMLEYCRDIATVNQYRKAFEV